MRILKKFRTKSLIVLIVLTISAPVFAVKPANVVVLIDQAEADQQQTVSLLYNTAWQMLDGEFDVRFTTPKMSKVDDVYSDDDVDLIIALGHAGATTVQQRKAVEKPTIVVNLANETHVQTNNVTNLVGVTMDQNESSSVFMERVVVALREKLRNK